MYRADNPLAQQEVAEDTTTATEDAVNSILPELSHARLRTGLEAASIAEPDPLAPEPEPEPVLSPAPLTPPKPYLPQQLSPTDQSGQSRVHLGRVGAGPGRG